MADYIITQTTQTLTDQSGIKEAFMGISEIGANDYAGKTFDIFRLTRAINRLAIDSTTLDGSGSPEGLITSNLTKIYIDTDVNQLYFNPVVGVNTGWVAL